MRLFPRPAVDLVSRLSPGGLGRRAGLDLRYQRSLPDGQPVFANRVRADRLHKNTQWLSPVKRGRRFAAGWRQRFLCHRPAIFPPRRACDAAGILACGKSLHQFQQGEFALAPDRNGSPDWHYEDYRADADTEEFQTGAATTVTAEDGTYTLHFLAPGTYSVTVTAPDGYATDPVDVDVTLDANEDATGVDFAIVEPAG